MEYAQATTVDVRLDVEDSDVVVTVVDDGVGLDPAAAAVARPGHLGMQVAHTLSQSVGGSWQVESASGTGTRVRFRVPRAMA